MLTLCQIWLEEWNILVNKPTIQFDIFMEIYTTDY